MDDKIEKKALVVTTSHRGVFFGYGTPTNEKVIKLENCRMCIYWSEDVKGVVGLAFTGPLKGSRVTPAAPSMTLQDVTAIMEVTDKAIMAWEKVVWD